MKQRIRTVGIIKQEDTFLFFKRIQGRSEEVPIWELLTGKIQFGEQPEEAMSRALFEFAGVHAEKMILKDVITFIAPEGSSRLSNLYIVYNIILKKDEKISPEDRYSAYKYVKLDDIASLRLDEASLTAINIEEEKRENIQTVSRGVANGATIYVDGCSRGNPGPAGIGYYIIGADGQVLKQGGEFIGFASSRVAEYRALKMGIEQAKSLGLKSVRFVSDNLMAVNQLNGIYRVKNADLAPIYREIKQMVKDFEACTFVHIKRSQNRQADYEANLAVDRHFDRSVLK